MSLCQILTQVSDEMRHPTSALLGLAQQLLETELSLPQRDHLQGMQRNAEALLAIVDDVLDYARLEAGELALETLAFDLRVMLHSLEERLEPQARDRGVALTFAVHDDVPARLVGDPGRLRQVLSSVVGAAVRCTGSGSVSVGVWPIHESPSAAQIRFTVEEGEGALREWVLGRGVPQRTGLGTAGLGLTIARRLVQMMGGEVRVEGGEEERATIVIELELARQRAEPVPAQIRGDLSGVRVLVVCDDVTDRASLTEMLGGWECRHELGTVYTFREQLHAAVSEKDPFVVALLDLALSPEDLGRLGRDIKDEPKLGQTELVVIVATARRGDAARMQASGFSAYLSKPVADAQLRDCLVTLAARQHGQPGSIITRHSMVEQRKHAVRILVVMAELRHRDATCRVLERMGYAATLVAEPAEALALLGRETWDLLLIETTSREAESAQTIQLVRAPTSAVPNRALPIVAATAQAASGEDGRWIERGASAWLPVPLDAGRLCETIEGLLPMRLGPAPAAEMLPQVLDRQDLLSRLGGDEVLCDEVLQAFLQTLPSLIEGLRRGLVARDGAQIRLHGRVLKDAATNVSAHAIRSLAHRILQAVEERTLGPVAALLEQVEQEVARLSTHLSPNAEPRA